MNTSGPSFSAHSDVLDAPVPDTYEGQNRLLEEIKNRGRSAVQAGNWPDASRLYRKALDVMKSKDNNDDGKLSEIAILNANLSLTEGKMNLWEDAQRAAMEATYADPSYVKGWWRLGQAQAANGKYDDAVVSLGKGLALEQENKALQKELTKMKEKAAKEKVEAAKRKILEEQKAEELAKKEATTMKTSKSVVSKTTSDRGEDSKKENSKNTSEPVDVDTDGAGFTKSDFVRGYKVVNGKKTSYFHNELSEDAKRLIGDIAPKRLDSTLSENVGSGAPNSSSSIDPATATSTSVWNQAGTWEEKDVSNWAQETLESSLKKAVYLLPPSSPAPGAIISVTKVSAKGHASVASVRGKKRYIYEYSIKVHWNFIHHRGGGDGDGDSKTTTSDGTMKFPDVDGTCVIGEGYDATNFEIKTASDDTVRPLLDTFVHKQGLRNVLHEAIDGWVRTFQEMY